MGIEVERRRVSKDVHFLSLGDFENELELLVLKKLGSRWSHCRL